MFDEQSAYIAHDRLDRTELPAASVIICSRNRPQLLLESVQSVMGSQELPREIIIMDQSDQEHAVLAGLVGPPGCTVRYIRTKSIGECPARNEGIALANHDLLVFTDDDVFVPGDWFGTIVRALHQAGPRSVVTGRVLASQPDSPGGFAPTLSQETTPAVYSGRPGKDVLFPMNMAFYRSAVDEIGGFDVRFGAGGPFMGSEDNDYCFRLLEAGYRILHVPEAMLYHRAWRHAKDYMRLRWIYGYCRGAYYAKHLSLTDRYMLNRLGTDVWRHLVRMVRYGLQRPPRHSCGDGLFALGVLYGVAQWLVTQPRTG